jgi:glycosyltransferase involved in cell wall biosynthesis
MVLSLGDDWLDYGPRLDAWARLWLAPSRRLLGQVVGMAVGVPAVLPDLGALGGCCFNSEATRRFAREHTPWTFPRTGVVYSGIEAEDFPAAAPDAPVAERLWRGRLLYVGRIDDRKGIDGVIRALPLLPGASLRVAGRGDDAALAGLEALAAELGVADRVEFGAVPRAELAGVYRQADVLVFPSTWHEPFGLVPIEAMACDTPVVATGTGGSGEFLVDGSNCVLYPAGDHAALAAAVQRLAGDALLRAALVRGGRVTAAALTTDALADALEEWHLAAIDGYPHGTPPDRRLPSL